MKARYFSGNRKYKILFYVLLGSIAGVALLILFGLAVKFLWNATIASMFGLTTITFWQAFGLFILAKLFFGFGGGGAGPAARHRRKRRKREHGTDGAPRADDEAFRQFWQAEGKSAYEAYREQPRDDGDERRESS